MPKRPDGPTELYATPVDIVRAHLIVEEELGPDVDVNYMDMPKNVGQKGDEGFRGHSVIISAGSEAVKRAILDDRQGSIKDDYGLLADVSLRITNETHAATRVLFDITPDGGFFEVEKE